MATPFGIERTRLKWIRTATENRPKYNIMYKINLATLYKITKINMLDTIHPFNLNRKNNRIH